jgi:uncharacterized protein YdaL
MRAYIAKEGARRRTRTLALALTLLLLLPASAFASHRDDDDDDDRNSSSAAPVKTLVLYDTAGSWGWMGEKYAIATANLVSHFGTWTAKPVAEYSAGEMAGYKAVVYIGSTYDEPIPSSFLDDTLADRGKVVWLGWNIWQLSNRAGAEAFKARYGWKDGFFNNDDIPQVTYKGQAFTRNVDSRAVMDYHFLDRSVANVLAEARTSSGYAFPWAIRSSNLTYVGEVPFSYMSETDRYLIFSDLLFDVLAPETQERHRALVRLEDIGCDSDPDELDAISDYLDEANIPYSFGVYPVFKDPQGIDSDGRPTKISLRDRECRDVVDEIKDMIRDGGTMIMHGYTHQLDSGASNPYNGKSGDDFEFFMAHVDEQDYVRYDGPVPGDSFNWALGRMAASAWEFARAGLSVPKIFEFPHYAGSAQDYKAAKSMFSVRYERALYFNRLLRPGAVDSGKFMGQFFPYVVNDVYGSKVLPENIGNIETESFNHHPVTMPDELINRARLNLAVRDGFASFFYHPHLGVDLLRQTVEGIQGMGYTFVSPTSL